MRLFFVLALALSVLPLSGCAKKKTDESPSSAANADGSSDANYDPPMAGDSSSGGHSSGGVDDSSAMDDTADYAPPEDTSAGADSADLVADSANSQNSNYFNEGASQSGQGSGDSSANSSSAGGHGQGNSGNQPAAGANRGGDSSANSSSAGGHGQGNSGNAPATSANSSSAGGHGQGNSGNQPAAGANGGGTSPAAAAHGAGNSSAGVGVDTTTDAGMTTTTDDGATGTQGSEGSGEGGQPAQNPKKASDIPGVKEDTAEYAAVSLILKVSRGETEGYQSLIAEDVSGLLKELRGDGDELKQALAEGKELMGQVRPINTRLVDRDTVVTFQNNHEKVLQFYVRRIKDKYYVREIRIKEAVKAPVRRTRD